MPHYSELSKKALKTCHKDLQTIFNQVIRGVDCSILCGFRSEAAQTMAVEQGRSKVPWPYSRHNQQPALAVDVAPYPVDWNDKEAFVHFSGYVKGVADQLYLTGKVAHRLKWGGDFEGFFDGPHYELIEA